MLQAANNDLINPLVPKAHNSQRQNKLFSLEIKSESHFPQVDGFLFLASSALVG